MATTSSSKSNSTQPVGVATIEVVPAADVQRLVKVIVILGLATTISVVAALLGVYASISKKTTAVAVDARGTVVPVVPLNAPMVSESRVLGFVEECMRKSFSHDFLHYDQTIPLAQECFMSDSADKYAQSMQPFVKLMESKRMVMSLTIPRPARVVRVYTKMTALGEVVHWDVQAQVDVFYEGRNERIPPTRNNVEITVRRVPLEGTPRGILIDKFSVSPA